MTLTLDATVGGANANSLLSVARSDEVAAYRVGGDTWIGLPLETKKLRLIAVSERILALALKGSPTFAIQAQAFPRTGLTTRTGVPIDASTIPSLIEQAVVAWGIQMPAAGAASSTVDPNIKRVKADDVEVEFFAAGAVATDPAYDTADVPADVLRLISCFLADPPSAVASGWGSASAVRGS